MSDDVLVRVENVSKRFCRSLKRSLWYGLQDLGSEIGGRRHGGGRGLPQSSADIQLRPDEFWAVKDVSFELRRGECLGLIGRNGAGKTTLLRMLNGLIKPDTGSIKMRGRVGALIALGAGFNPLLTGRENIYISGSVLGYSKKEMESKIEEIVSFAEIEQFIDSPVQTYSSGMQVRLGFSIASILSCEIILLDEVLAVGDARFRSKCWRRVGEIIEDSAVILVSHEAYALSRICDRGLVLSGGQAQFAGAISSALEYYTEDEFQDSDLSEDYRYSFTDPLIEGYRLSEQIVELQQGEDCSLMLDIAALEDIIISHSMININDRSDMPVAQVLADFPDSTIRQGRNNYIVRIKNLRLPKGDYWVVILLSGANGKKPILHSRHQAKIRVHGHPDYGPKYYPESCITMLK
jgi:lipopolysaccharide transport system ATP-binding protein